MNFFLRAKRNKSSSFSFQFSQMQLPLKSQKKHIMTVKNMHYIDESTCCDEDFTWVRTDPPIESRSLPTDQVAISPSTNNSSAKPPRPAGSLDRRRISHTNRQERDSKSRSAHSLKERSVSSEFKDASNEKGRWRCLDAMRCL